MNWLIVYILSAALAVSYADPEIDTTTISQLSQELESKTDASEIESATPTPTSYVDLSQEDSIATTVLESNLETSTSGVSTKLETVEVPVVSERGSEIVEQQSVESKTDTSFLLTTEVTFQDTEEKQTTVSSLNENNEVFLSPVIENQSVTTLASAEESVTVSAQNSEVSQGFQTEPVTIGIKEVETVRTTVKPVEIFVLSNTVQNQEHSAISSTPLQTVPGSTGVTNVESSSVSVSPISETLQSVQAETSPFLQPSTEVNVPVVVFSETSQSFSIQTESSPTVPSSSQKPFPSPLVPDLSKPSSEQIKTKPVLLEVLGNTPVSVFEEPIQSANTLVLDPSTHVTVVNRVPSVDQHATIVHQENVRNNDGSYDHGYESSNGILFHEKGFLRDYNKTDVKSGEPVRNIVATGSFAWTAPNGKNIGIKYYADETGYHPEGDAIPTPPPSPPQILKALAWIQKVLAEKKLKELKKEGERLDN